MVREGVSAAADAEMGRCAYGEAGGVGVGAAGLPGKRRESTDWGFSGLLRSIARMAFVRCRQKRVLILLDGWVLAACM